MARLERHAGASPGQRESGHPVGSHGSVYASGSSLTDLTEATFVAWLQRGQANAHARSLGQTSSGDRDAATQTSAAASAGATAEPDDTFATASSRQL